MTKSDKNAIPAGLRYRGFRTAGGWEVVVEKPGRPPRLLDLPRHASGWARIILSDCLGDEARAEDLYKDFASLTIDRYTEDWELSGDDIENVITEVEILRARWRRVLMRG